jgi:HD-GYP domain-containing protein (c-di-GMP phosphodiesterase class II)
MIHYHQERYDGSGYPLGLRGEQIPIGARILAVVDAYEAMTSDRIYRKALRFKAAMQEIQTGSGKHFDPLVTNAFFDTMRIM